jgi:hypothetical protein
MTPEAPPRVSRSPSRTRCEDQQTNKSRPVVAPSLNLSPGASPNRPTRAVHRSRWNGRCGDRRSPKTMNRNSKN